MACMEHECEDCKEMWFDNKASGQCSACGSSEVRSFFDEVRDSQNESDEAPWDVVLGRYDDGRRSQYD